MQLDHIRQRASGEMRVFFATSKNRALSQLLQTRGHLVVQLPGDLEKRNAIREYLIAHCGAESFDGRIECAEKYDNLTLFEKALLSELEQTIVMGYDVSAATLIPGRLTEDVPVYVPDSTGPKLTIYVDVRHADHKAREARHLTAADVDDRSVLQGVPRCNAPQSKFLSSSAAEP